ncbi:MAG: class I SAM-dependent methyltransferase, partial [Promethearchaeota archaeon]
MNFFKKMLHYVEPEGIPFPGSIIYDKIMQNFDLYDLLLQKIAESDLISNIKGTILDVGTGPARLPIYIIQNNPACKVVGLDVSSSMIHLAAQNIQKAKLPNTIYLKTGNVSELPFPDQSFNFIISTGSFHHWKLPITAFNEIYRVLKYNSEAWIF